MIRKPTLADLIDWPHLAEVLFTPSDRRPIWEWAQDNVRMPARFPAEFSGLFSVEKGIGRLGIPILQALANPEKRQVDLYKPPRGSGSLWADLWTLHCIARDPGDMLIEFDKDESATDFSKTRSQELFRLCPPVAGLKSLNRFDSSNHLFIFAHGMVVYIQGSSPGLNQSKPARYLRTEELWKWRPGRYGEAEARLGDYRKSNLDVVFNQSQGGWADGGETEDGPAGNDMEDQWSKGSQANLHVPCERCRQFFPVEIDARREDGTRCGLNWPDNANTRTADGQWRTSEVLKDFWVECPHCRHQHRDQDKFRHSILFEHRFIPANPDAPAWHDSFRYNSLAIERWEWLIDKWCDALNDRVQLRGNLKHIQFIQKYEARAVRREDEIHVERVELYDPNVEMVDKAGPVMTVDRHGDGMMWIVVWIWSRNGTDRLHWYGVAHSPDEIEKLRKDFGIKNPGFVGIDYGQWQKETLALCAHYGWTAIWGHSREFFSHTHDPVTGRRYVEPVNRIWCDARMEVARKLAKYPGTPTIITKAAAFRLSKPATTRELFWRRRKGLHTEPLRSPNPAWEKFYQRHMNCVRWDSTKNAFVAADAEDHFWDASRMQLFFADRKEWHVVLEDSALPNAEVTAKA